MQAPVSLRVGVHIEQVNMLTLVHRMLAQAGHHALMDIPGSHSLADYLEAVLKEVQQDSSSPYDLLIIGGVDTDALTDPAVLFALEHLFARKPLLIMVITHASDWQLRTWQTFSNVAILPENHLSMHRFFQTLGRLTQSFSGVPNPIFMPTNLVVPQLHEQLIEEERSRITVHQGWLDQRQEWLEQRQIWLEQRQAWLEAMEQEQDPQHELLIEQRVRLEQQRRELEDQQREVKDQWLTLTRYQRQIDEDFPGSKHSAQ